MNILVIAPHADDEILGCGATIAKHIRNNNNVYVLIVTNANVGAPELFSSKEIDNIRKEAKLAHNLLGIIDSFIWDFPAPRLNTFESYKISNKITKLINKIKPEIVYLPHRGDIHLDHKVVFESALVALRPNNNFIVNEIYCYETLSETEWAQPFSDTVFFPNHFNIVSKKDMQNKLKAMSMYKSQLKEFPNPRSLKAIENLARLRGSTINQDFAESFYLIRKINN